MSRVVKLHLSVNQTLSVTLKRRSQLQGTQAAASSTALSVRNEGTPGSGGQIREMFAAQTFTKTIKSFKNFLKLTYSRFYTALAVS